MTWELRLGDCLDPVTGMASLADKSVDHVITDPPYSEHVHSNAKATDGKVHAIEFAPIGNDTRITASAQFARLSRRWCVVFSEEEGAHEWRHSMILAGLDYIRTGRWIRLGNMPQISGDRPAQGDEAIVISHPRGRKAWNGGGRAALWSFAKCGADGPVRLHSTQKPEALMEKLIADFTDPGDTILDPFAGSGTTGVAAIRLGRRFIGWERDPKYHAIATKRLAVTREQMELFRSAK